MLDFILFVLRWGYKDKKAYHWNLWFLWTNVNKRILFIKSVLVNNNFEKISSKLEKIIINERYFLNINDLESLFKNNNYEPLESSYVKKFFWEIVWNDSLFSIPEFSNKIYYNTRIFIHFLEYFTNINDVLEYYSKNIFNKVEIEFDEQEANIKYLYYMLSNYRKKERADIYNRVNGKYFLNVPKPITAYLNQKILFLQDIRDLSLIYSQNIS